MSTSTAEHDRWTREAGSTALCLAALLAGVVLSRADAPLATGIAGTVAFVAGGLGAARRSVSALGRGKLDVDLLMVTAALGAAAVGHWVEGAILLFLFSTGNTLETFAFGRTRRSIEALMDLRPEDASVVLDGIEERRPVAELGPGTVVRVRPGDRIPVDGVVVAGGSAVDESTLTGEAAHVRKETGAEVFAGTLNGSGSLDIRVSRGPDDTALARVIRLVEQAREAKAPTQGWIEAVEGRYAGGVLGASALAVLIPWLVLGWSFDAAFYRAMTLLVVASPCALVISIPATIVSAVANGARRGVLFKGGVHLDALASIRVVAVDKTGTLTVGRPDVADIVAVPGALTAPGVTVGAAPDRAAAPMDEAAELLRLAAAVEVLSEHPLGEAVRRAADERGLDLPAAESFDSLTGRGVQAVVEGRLVRVGRPSWIAETATSEVPPELRDWTSHEERRAATPVLVSVDGLPAGAFAVADRVRPGAADAVAALRREGVDHVVMLTGDHTATARAVAQEVGVDEVHAELLPEDKSGVLESLRTRYGPVAMLGDGVNDAPALASADVGIAIGAVGTDVAMETADLVVMGDDLRALAHGVGLSRRARTIVRQNLVFSVSVMGTLVVLALGGWIGLTAGVIGHEGSTVVVVFNGLRLLAYRS